jgi:hypothetical protein
LNSNKKKFPQNPIIYFAHSNNAVFFFGFFGGGGCGCRPIFESSVPMPAKLLPFHRGKNQVLPHTQEKHDVFGFFNSHRDVDCKFTICTLFPLFSLQKSMLLTINFSVPAFPKRLI